MIYSFSYIDSDGARHTNDIQAHSEHVATRRFLAWLTEHLQCREGEDPGWSDVVLEDEREEEDDDLPLGNSFRMRGDSAY